MPGQNDHAPPCRLMVKFDLTGDFEMRSLVLPSDSFCFETAGLRLSLCPARSGLDVQQRAGELAVHEARNNIPDGATRIVALINHPEALLRAASFSQSSSQLIAIAWDAAALAKALQAQEESETLHHASSLIVMAARSAGVLALDTVAPTLSDQDLMQACEQARRNGFDGKLAATERQLQLITQAFS